MRSYSEAMSFDTFQERYEYLKLNGRVGSETFGHERYLNQAFYMSQEWKDLRKEIILRDDGCDLGCEDRPIFGKIYIHHIEPITYDDLIRMSGSVMDPENLICVSYTTHQAIHYGNSESLYPDPVERYPNDTCPWKKVGSCR